MKSTSVCIAVVREKENTTKNTAGITPTGDIGDHITLPPLMNPLPLHRSLLTPPRAAHPLQRIIKRRPNAPEKLKEYAMTRP